MRLRITSETEFVMMIQMKMKLLNISELNVRASLQQNLCFEGTIFERWPTLHGLSTGDYSELKNAGVSKNLRCLDHKVTCTHFFTIQDICQGSHFASSQLDAMSQKFVKPFQFSVLPALIYCGKFAQVKKYT
ncbi:hypothetical protein PTKIN_Ptkin09bG0237600 [Pterospermum kingtungense]